MTSTGVFLSFRIHSWDDTIDVCRNSSEKEQEEVTKWMNKNIYKDKIAFKIESIGEEIKFLDTIVNVVKDHKADDEDQFLLIPLYRL